MARVLWSTRRRASRSHERRLPPRKSGCASVSAVYHRSLGPKVATAIRPSYVHLLLNPSRPRAESSTVSSSQGHSWALFTAFLSQPSPILIAEVAYPTHRGKVTALYNTFYVSINITERISKDESTCLQNLRSTSVPYLQPGKQLFLSMNNPLTDASRGRSYSHPHPRMRILPLGASFMTPDSL